MKIEKLELFGFGKFSEKEILLHDKQLIFGENEAGKSTLFSFIKFMLFGFKAKDKTHREFKPLDSKIYGGRISVVLENSIYSIKRSGINNKSNKQEIVIKKNEELISETEWLKAISPMTQELFEKVYTLSQENLNLHAEKDMGEEELEALWKVTASTGTQELTQKINALTKDLPGLYKPTGKIPIINQMLHQLEKINQQIEGKIEESERLAPNIDQVSLLNQKFITLQNKIQVLEGKITRLRQQLNYQADYENYLQLLSYDYEKILPQEKLNHMSSTFESIVTYENILERLANELEESIRTYNQLKTSNLDFYQKTQSKIQEILTSFPKIYVLLNEHETLKTQNDLLKSNREKRVNAYQLETTQFFTNAELQQFAKRNQKQKSFFSRAGLIVAIIVIFTILFILRSQMLLAFAVSLIAGLISYLLIYFVIPTNTAAESEISFEAASEHNQRLLELENIEKEIAENEQLINNQENQLDSFYQVISFADEVLNAFGLPLQAKMNLLADFDKQSVVDLKQIELIDINGQQQEKQKLENELIHLKNKFPNYKDLPLIKEQQEHLKLSKQQLTQLVERLTQHFDLSKSVNFEELTREMIYFKNEMATLNIELEKIRNERSRITSELSFLQTDGVLDDLYQEKEHLIFEIHEKIQEWTLKSSLIETYQRVLAELSEITLPEILAFAQSSFKFLTDDRYCNIFLENQVLMVETFTHKKLRVIDLSTGTKDQLLLALRLALVKSKKLNFPIFVDDAFLRYDSKRKDKVFDLFKDYHDSQLIIFSSDLKIKAFFEENNEAVEVLE